MKDDASIVSVMCRWVTDKYGNILHTEDTSKPKLCSNLHRAYKAWSLNSVEPGFGGTLRDDCVHQGLLIILTASKIKNLYGTLCHC